VLKAREAFARALSNSSSSITVSQFSLKALPLTRVKAAVEAITGNCITFANIYIVVFTVYRFRVSIFVSNSNGIHRSVTVYCNTGYGKKKQKNQNFRSKKM
jgi:hypothetical protein